MGKTFRVVISLFGLVGLGACSARFDHTGLRLDHARTKAALCGGDPATMGVSPEASRNVFVLKDKIDDQRRKTIDCNGVVISDKPEPVRLFGRVVKISAPKLDGEITQIEVSNQRTCGQIKVDRTAPAGTPNVVSNSLRPNGDAELLVSDDATLEDQGILHVVDGMNPVKIRYLDRNQNILGQRELVLELAVERNLIGEENQPRRVRECQ